MMQDSKKLKKIKINSRLLIKRIRAHKILQKYKIN